MQYNSSAAAAAAGGSIVASQPWGTAFWASLKLWWNDGQGEQGLIRYYDIEQALDYRYNQPGPREIAMTAKK